ncbi:MAG: DNA cytosine methyltransferase [Candidatus Omnitrophica bacterium]|nr:DNA cytosine methyltransferase [Candidatus Omnitrophota bacterium]MDE2215475.1 DNA cytosine methyltransferase [Candidatus Omnitrophota bacterium]
MLVLSIFPGIGMLDLAFELEGFCTVRGPDVIWGGDVRKFHPPSGKFDGVIGGPPCQTFSALAHLVRANGHEPKFGDLIPEFERCVTEAQPAWFLMENVPAAPMPIVPGYGVKSFLLDNSHLDGGDGHGLEQRRVRRFSFGMRGRGDVPSLLRWIDVAVFLLPDSHEPLTGGGERPPSVRDKVRRTAVNAGHDDPNISLTMARRVRRKSVLGGGTFTPGATLKKEGRGKAETSRRYRLIDGLRLQGLPENFLDHCPFTAEGKLKAVANGVPIQMGRAVAKAIKESLRC